MRVFFPYQERWVLDRSRVKIAVKSRRIGITWATAYEAVEVASADERAGGSDFWYQTYAEDDAKEFIDDSGKWSRAIDALFTIETETVSGDEAHEYFILPEGEHSIKITSIRFTSGFRITALPHSPRKLRGKGGVYCLDEAASHDDVEGAIKAATAFQVWGGRLIFISTVVDEDNEFTKLFRDVQAGRSDYSLHIITLADAFEEGLYVRVCEKSRQEWTQEKQDAELARLLATPGAEQEFLCIPRRSGGVYLSASMVQSCMVDAPVVYYRKDDDFLLLDESDREADIDQWLESEVAPLLKKMKKNLPSYFGQDFGRSMDLTAIAVGQETQDLKLNVPFMLELANVPFESQKQITRYVLKGLPRLSFAALDATGNGAYLGEHVVSVFGEEMAEAVHTTLPWYAENLPKLKARFEDRTITLPKDLDVRQDLGMLEVIDGVPRLPKRRIASQREKGQRRHGDSAIALAMLNYAVTKPAMAYGYQKTERRAGHFAYEGLL